MKKLLTLLGVLGLSALPVTSVVACGGGSTDHPDAPDTNNLSALDWAKEIFSTYLVDESNKGNFVFDSGNDSRFKGLSKYYQVGYENWKPQKETDFPNNDDTRPTFAFLSEIIQNKLSQVNNKIKNEIPDFFGYAGYPITMTDNPDDIKYQISGVDIGDIRDNSGYKEIQILNITTKISFKVSLKDGSEEPINNQPFSFVFTNQRDNYLEIMKDLGGKVYDLIKDVFAKNILNMNDDNDAFKSLVTALNLDYENDNSPLQKIYTKKIMSLINKSPDLKNVINVDEEHIIQTNKESNSKFLRVNTVDNKYYPNDENSPKGWYSTDRTKKGADFSQFYRGLQKITPDSDTKNYTVANVTWNPSSISVYGIPLVETANLSQNLVVPAEVFEANLSYFGDMVSEFLNFYQVEFRKEGILYRRQNSPIFNIARTGESLDKLGELDYRGLLDFLVNSFKSNNDVKAKLIPATATAVQKEMFAEFNVSNAMPNAFAPTKNDWGDSSITYAKKQNIKAKYTLGHKGLFSKPTDFGFSLVPKDAKNSDIPNSYMYYTAWSRFNYLLYFVND